MSTARETATLRQELQTFKKALETTYTLDDIDDKTHILDPLPARFGRIENFIVGPGAIPSRILFDKIYFDSFGYYNPTNPTEFKVPAGGIYRVTAAVRWLAPQPDAVLLIGKINPGGSDTIAYNQINDSLSGSDSVITQYVETIYEFISTDAIVVEVSHGAGSDRQILVADHSPIFTIERCTTSGGPRPKHWP